VSGRCLRCNGTMVVWHFANYVRLEATIPMKTLTKCLLPSLLIAFCALGAHAQTNCPAYTFGLLASSRISNWCQNAGLPATLPDGETPPNAWTPPTRTQCGSTLPSTTPYASINSAIAACSPGTYVLLGPGTFSTSPTTILLDTSGVTLRGSGADKTKLLVGSGGGVSWSTAASQPSGYTWSAGYSAGTTVITLSGSPAVGTMLNLTGTGSATDTGSVWVCSDAGVCSEQSSTMTQYEMHAVTHVSGSSVTISPPISFPAFASLTSLSAGPVTNITSGAGLEDVTVDCTSAGGGCLNMSSSYGSWMKGVRVINGGDPQMFFSWNTNCLLMSNYFTQPIAHTAEPTNPGGTGFNLILNNTFQSSGSFIQGAGSSDVYAYNLARDAYNNSGSYYVNNTISNHTVGLANILVEGNEIGNWQEDSVHGDANLDTFFRNIFYGTDPPYNADTSNGLALIMYGVARMENIVGNVMGNPTMTSYKCTKASCGSNPVVAIGGGGATGISDTLSSTSAMFWGNYDIVTGAVRWCGNSSDPGWSTTCSSTSEVPTSLSGGGATYDNPVPSTTTLPLSFLFTNLQSGSSGTNLPFGKVCTNYTTAGGCGGSYQTFPEPGIGPDVSGGNVDSTAGFPSYGGHANHIPAYIAWKNLPIDTAYQNSYTITGSSWTGGTETLTVSSLPGVGVAGEFQISGGACAGTYMMKNSTSTTVSYAAASNPGSCTSGAFLFPDVRAFNEIVYASDSGSSSGGPPPPPQNLKATVQ